MALALIGAPSAGAVRVASGGAGASPLTPSGLEARMSARVPGAAVTLVEDSAPAVVPMDRTVATLAVPTPSVGEEDGATPIFAGVESDGA